VDQLNRDFWGRTDWEWLHRDAGEKGNSGGFDDSDDDDDDDEEEDGDSDSTGDGSEGEVRMENGKNSTKLHLILSLLHAHPAH
jgi:hypothetical protein